MGALMENYGFVIILIVFLFVYRVYAIVNKAILNNHKKQYKLDFKEVDNDNTNHQYKELIPSDCTYNIIQLNRRGKVIQKKIFHISNGERFTLGTSQKCDMRIEDNSIDELQIIISKDNKGMFLINNSMLCKLYYDRKSVRQVDIADGTLIFLGNYIYKFREVRHESKIQTVE